jgi:outer membrane lipoprotein-sorting protein
MQAEAADDETSTNYKRNEANEFPDPFLDYAKKGYSVELMGEETVEGTETFKIKLTKNPILVDGAEEDLFVIYYFDKENFVPIMQESTIPSGPQKGMKVQTLFSDYQEAGKIFYPYTISIKYNGQLAQSINIEKMDMNVEIDDALFTMPEPPVTEEKKE